MAEERIWLKKEYLPFKGRSVVVNREAARKYRVRSGVGVCERERERRAFVFVKRCTNLNGPERRYTTIA
jgi:hypothetical protein